MALLNTVIKILLTLSLLSLIYAVATRLPLWFALPWGAVMFYLLKLIWEEGGPFETS